MKMTAGHFPALAQVGVADGVSQIEEYGIDSSELLLGTFWTCGVLSHSAFWTAQYTPSKADRVAPTVRGQGLPAATAGTRSARHSAVAARRAVSRQSCVSVTQEHYHGPIPLVKEAFRNTERMPKDDSRQTRGLQTESGLAVLLPFLAALKCWWGLLPILPSGCKQQMHA